MNFIYVIVISVLCLPVFAADQMNSCNGELKDRNIALKALGEFAVKYKIEYKMLPALDIFTETPKEFEVGIPTALAGYYIYKEANSIGYMCNLEDIDTEKYEYVTQSCEINLTSKEILCGLQEMPKMHLKFE